MFNSKTPQNYLTDCASKHLPPELQHAARQAIADNQLNPLLFEAVAKQIEESAVVAAKAGAGSNAQAITELLCIARNFDKRFVDRDSVDTTKTKMLEGITDVASHVGDVRNSMRILEDKLDMLAPYQLWKVALIAGITFVIGAVASWNIRPAYKQWVWEQQQQEGRY